MLHPSHITDSVKAGRWLNEELYEWGRETNCLISNKETSSWRLVLAARKWRLKTEGVFEGMKFIPHTRIQKRSDLKKVTGK